MNRTVIEISNDGNTLFTREAPLGTPGSARDRRALNRAKEGQEREWRRLDRTIVRPGKALPEDVAALGVVPMNSPEILAQACENDITAGSYGSMAEQVVAEINSNNAAFHITPAPKMRVVFVSE